MSGSVLIRKTIRGQAPRIQYEKIARSVLGDKYHLSLVICGDRLSQGLNKQYRNKSYYPNVLSFELDTHEGEIFLNVRCAEREAKKYGVSLMNRVGLLFVHGLYHLKGMDHGTKMEQREARTLAKFGFA